MQIKNLNLLLLFFVIIVATYSSVAHAYITPGEFIGEEPSGDSSSSSSSVDDDAPPIPDLINNNNQDVVIPELVSEGSSSSNGELLPIPNLIQNNDNQDVVTSDPVSNENYSTENSSFGTYAKDKSGDPKDLQGAHNAAPYLVPMGMPFAVTAILSLICAGFSFYAFRKGRLTTLLRSI